MLAEVLFFIVTTILIVTILNLISKLTHIIFKMISMLMKAVKQVKLYILSLMFLFCMVFLMSINTLPCDANTCSGKSVGDYFAANWLPILMLFAIGYCEKIRREFEFVLAGNSGDSLKILECKSESYEHLTFLATYIIPFLGFNFESIFRLLAYLMLLVIIGIIFIRTDKYYANPTLAIFGYKLYKVTLSDCNNHYESITVLTKSNLKAGQNVSYQFISDTVCFVRKIINE
ncbi:anti-phage protein KwaA [Vibrio furnissii]|uniref:anti-phage protein KwaA n=1 Tax=Vibrio furnissii TaxID=29494 RepID=UPI00399C03B9